MLDAGEIACFVVFSCAISEVSLVGAEVGCGVGLLLGPVGEVVGVAVGASALQ